MGEFGIPRSLNSIELAMKNEEGTRVVVSFLGLHTAAVSVVAES